MGGHPAAGAAWRIRPATPEDAPAIRAVAAAGWRDTYAGIMEAEAIERFLAGAYSEASVRRRIMVSDRIDVAVLGDLVIGFAEWALRDGEAELVATYLLPEWRRQGIGSALHARAIDAYRGRVDRTVLHVVRDNTGARAFYESLGYGNEQTGTFELFGAHIPELRLELWLEPAPIDAPGPRG